MLSLRTYSLVTTLCTMAAIYNAWSTRQQFYPAAIYLTTSKLNIVVLGNQLLLLMILFYKMIQKAFLGDVTGPEVDVLIENSKTAVIETCLALTVFPEQLNMLSLMLFTCLLFVKIFHWLASIRVEKVAQNEGLTKWTHIRLTLLLGFLLLVDGMFVYFMSKRIVPTRPSVIFLFVFEYTILFLAAISTGILYMLHCANNRMEGRWLSKSIWILYLETVNSIIRLMLYLGFFIVICSFYGLPFHLLRELIYTAHNLKTRWIKFMEFRRINKVIHKFPDATPEDLERNSMCVVCWDDMTQAKKLPKCGHIFHLDCLRGWLQESVSCPCCRDPLDIPALQARRNPRAPPPPPPAAQHPVPPPPPAPEAADQAPAEAKEHKEAIPSVSTADTQGGTPAVIPTPAGSEKQSKDKQSTTPSVSSVAPVAAAAASKKCKKKRKI